MKQIIDGNHVKRGIEAHTCTLQALFTIVTIRSANQLKKKVAQGCHRIPRKLSLLSHGYFHSNYGIMHSCQLSRNLRDSPEFLTCVPEGSRKSALAQIVPEKL